MRNIDMTNVQEAGDFQRPGAGAYICTITKVQDVPLNAATDKGDYLKIWYDIAEGEFKDYYTTMRKDHPEWENAGSYIRSYKEKALGMFKRFCGAVSESNGAYEFGTKNMDESTLTGRKIGLVFREEEYVSNSGEIKTRLQVFKEFPISKLSEQKVPDKKLLPDSDRPARPMDDDFVNVPEGETDSLPF